MNVAVYGEWRHGPGLDEAAERRFSAAFRPADESVCVWIAPEDPYVLLVGFDVDAASLEAALDAGRAEVVAAASEAYLPGRLAKVTSMTDEAYHTWTDETPQTP